MYLLYREIVQARWVNIYHDTCNYVFISWPWKVTVSPTNSFLAITQRARYFLFESNKNCQVKNNANPLVFQQNLDIKQNLIYKAFPGCFRQIVDSMFSGKKQNKDAAPTLPTILA